MRAVNIVGFKNSGKTSLAVALIRELTVQGIQAAAMKFTHQDGLDKAGTDTAKLLDVASAVGAMGEKESAMFWKGGRHFDTLLPLLGAEFVVVEGGKPLTVLPRIVIAGNPEEARALGAEPGGLALAVYGQARVEGVPMVNDMAALAKLAAQRAFLLPGLDCGACGRPDCRALAGEIVAGSAAASDCAALGGVLTIEVNGVPLALNPFVSRILASGIKGMLGELKGYAPGEAVIRLQG